MDDLFELRDGLLDVIGLISNHENARNRVIVQAVRDLVTAATRSLGGSGRPLIADPFAGGGTIPFEALRIGADAFASDLNPVAGTLNRVLLEAAPRFGDTLKRCVLEAGDAVRRSATQSLAPYYSSRDGRRQPVAYLWARWINCEGPGCGAQIPLTRSRCLMRRGKRQVAVDHVPTKNGGWTFKITDQPVDDMAGTIQQGHALCPRCGFTTRKERVREQLAARHGGTSDALLLAIAETTLGEQGRSFRAACQQDRVACEKASAELERLVRKHDGELPLLPLEPIPRERVWKNNPIRVHLYGMAQWADLFSPRQALALATLCSAIRNAVEDLRATTKDPELADAVGACLALALDREADHLNSLCTWNPLEPKLQHLFGRQAIPFVWDFAEADPLGDSVGDWSHSVETVIAALETTSMLTHSGTVRICSATEHPLPDDSVDALITDPPYYDAVPYATLADFFYVWLKRSLPARYLADFGTELSPKDKECVVDEAKGKGSDFFEATMRQAMAEGRRITRPDGIAVLVFAHKTTAGWESLLQAVLSAGWIVTASWPIGTEMATRLRAQGSAALGSSIHLVLRPREGLDGRLESETVGAWRDVVDELPQRLRAWMPRLATEGIVGADAIFACIGPALEIFSRYARVEKVSGEPVSLREYLENVWAAVSREALSMIFAGAETSGLEPDGRITAIWLWTLARPASGADSRADVRGEGETPSGGEEDDSRSGDSGASGSGFLLEYDAARKIAQGLGARLEELDHVVEVKGDTARLLSVHERMRFLFGRSEPAPTAKKLSKKKQMTLFAEIEDAAESQGWGDVGAPKAGATTLDRVHQAMLLFGAGRGEALKRFLVEEGVGRQPQFWKLSQSLSALYPNGCEEKRWIDGVLARKKGLGFG